MCKTRKLLVIFLLMGSYQFALGCGNEYGYTPDGKRIFTRFFYLNYKMLHFDTVSINEKLNELNQINQRGEGDYKTWSNISLNLMKLGQADSALKILIPLQAQFPDQYNLVANMGTAYELTGQLDSALKYISLGYKMDSTSHLGSEWVHVKILEAKINERRQPGWLKVNSVLDVDYLVNRVDSASNWRDIRNVESEIFYQIRTRVPFTPAPNQIIANLLVSAGDFNAQIGTYENALLAYTYAMRFEPNAIQDRKIKTKIKRLNVSRKFISEGYDLSPMFIRMMNRSKLDPEILLLGIDDFANELDSIQKAEWNRSDSIMLLQTQIDSVYQEAYIDSNLKSKQIEELLAKRIVYVGIGLLTGILLGLGIWFISKTFKK